MNLDNLDAAALREIVTADDWGTRAMLRAATRRSLYFMTKTTVCFAQVPNLMTARSFKESSDWLQNVITRTKRGLFQDPRDHIKSYRSTVSIPIWCAIQRPNEEYDHPAEIDRALRWLEDHPNMTGTDLRIVVGSETVERAADWVDGSRRHWLTNPILRWLYPELLWPNHRSPDYGRFKREEYFLPGRNNPTLEDGYLRAIGVSSAESGGRADGMLLDDLTSEKSVESTTEMAYRRKWVRSITQLLDKQDYHDPKGGFVLLITNRWTLDDANSEVLNTMGDWDVWHRQAYRCTVHDFGNCGREGALGTADCAPDTQRAKAEGLPPHSGIWPEKHKNLENIRKDKGPRIFAIQWLNQPAEDSELDETKIVPFTLEPATINIDGQPRRAMCVNIPTFTDEHDAIVWPGEMIPVPLLQSHVISVDPASAAEESEARKAGRTCRTAITWQAYDPASGRDFVLDVRADHWAPDDVPRQILDLYREVLATLGGTPPKILCERVAAQTYVATALRFLAQAEGVRINTDDIELVPPKRGVNKWSRIKARVGNRLNQYRLCVRDGLPLVAHEIRHAPNNTLDVLDAITQAEGHFLEVRGVTSSTVAAAKARRLRRKRRIMNAGITGV